MSVTGSLLCFLVWLSLTPAWSVEYEEIELSNWAPPEEFEFCPRLASTDNLTIGSSEISFRGQVCDWRRMNSAQSGVCAQIVLTIGQRTIRVTCLPQIRYHRQIESGFSHGVVIEEKNIEIESNSLRSQCIEKSRKFCANREKLCRRRSTETWLQNCMTKSAAARSSSFDRTN